MDKAFYKDLSLEQLITAREVYQYCFEETGNTSLLRNVESVSNEISDRCSVKLEVD